METVETIKCPLCGGYFYKDENNKCFAKKEKQSLWKHDPKINYNWGRPGGIFISTGLHGAGTLRVCL